jgi:hypothetical protein
VKVVVCAEHEPEFRLRIHTSLDHLPVSIFKDMKWNLLEGKEDQFQRKKRQFKWLTHVEPLLPEGVTEV